MGARMKEVTDHEVHAAMADLLRESSSVLERTAERLEQGHVLDESLEERCAAVAMCVQTVATSLHLFRSLNGNG